MYRIHLTRVVGTALLVAGLATSVEAQGPTLSLPNGQLYPAGPDYATDVLQDPWDFANIDDISPDPDDFNGWTLPSAQTIRTNGTGPAYITGGRLVGTATDEHSPLALLYRGDALALNPGRSGIRFPIETARYRKLAFKLKVSGAGTTQEMRVFWFHQAAGAPGWENVGATFVPEVIPADASERIYTVDLSQSTAPSYVPYLTHSLVRGLRLNPVQAASQAIEIDWVRLTSSNGQAGSAMMPVSLGTCTGFQRLTVTETGTSVQNVVTDSMGTDQSRTFNYGIFPPGSYQVAATCDNGISSPAPFLINAPPTVTVIDPDETGDPATDYATQVRGDAWDFSQLSDIARAFNVSTTGGVCPPNGAGCGIVPSDRPGGGTMFRASSVGAFGDPGLEFLDGARVPLNSRRHQLLTFSLRIHRPYFLSAVVGPVLRVLWSSAATGDGNSMTHTQDMRVWPGFKTYTVDLGSLSTANGGIETECAGCPKIPWLTRAIRHFRIDPHEIGDAPSAFDIDDVTLTAPDEVTLGQQFSVRYRFSDPDTDGSSRYTAKVYRENWPDRTGRTLLATVPDVTPNGQLAYAFSPQATGVPAGRYLIAIDVDEARGPFTQTSRAYASGPIVVVDPGASSPQLSVAYPTPGAIVPVPFTLQGCAYDANAPAELGIGMDDIAVNARGITGQRAGLTVPLGFGTPRGTLQFGPLGTPIPCAGVPNTGSQFHHSGFRIADVGLEDGAWMIDVYARSTVSGQLVQLAEIPIQVGNVLPPPANFQASSSGNTVTVSWQPPQGGPPVARYDIEGSTHPSFSPLAFSLPVAAAGTYSGQLASGTYYLRVTAVSTTNVRSAPSATQVVNVALPSPPGAPALAPAAVNGNTVSLGWAPGAGGTPTGYTIYAGSTPGGQQWGVFPVGAATAISAVVGNGTYYARVVASNPAGANTSNEISFTVGAPPPGPPTLNPAVVDGARVTLSWAAPTAGGPPSSYVIIARYPGSPAVIATLPVLAGTSTVVNAPSGTYDVNVIAVNGGGQGAESNRIRVVVR